VAGSQHIYKTNEAEITQLLQRTEAPIDYKPFDPLAWFDEPQELIDWLWEAAKTNGLLSAMQEI
jgi:hypothetical protein